MNERTLPENRPRQRRFEVGSSVEAIRAPYDDISRDAKPPEGGVCPLREPVRRLLRIAHHDHQVVVATPVTLRTSNGSEEVNTIGLERRHDPADDLRERGVADEQAWSVRRRATDERHVGRAW